MQNNPIPQKALLTVNNLVVEFRIGRRAKIHAVSGVNFNIDFGETLGLVGESGCGKSTVARAIVGLQKPTGGQVYYGDEDLSRCTGEHLRKIRPDLQMIFQDSAASLNPGRKIGKTIEEPLRVLGKVDRHERLKRARSMMQAVGLDPDQMYTRYPFEFSGGQCQRASLARALIMKPRLLICDEPVSSLDVSTQAQILNLLEKMKRHFDLTMLFISHDLAVVKNISDRVAVMYLGKLCEIAPTEDLFKMPNHPYTAALISAIPSHGSGLPIGKVSVRDIEIPSPANPPSGCRFHTRCPNAQPPCFETEPSLLKMGKRRWVACHFSLKE